MAMNTVNGHTLPVDGNINTMSGSAEVAALVTAIRIMAEAINTSGGVDASVAEGALAIEDTTTAGLTVGPNGATNPTLKAGSVTGAATGVAINGAAAASGASISAISSGTNEALKINAKGTAALTLQDVATGAISLGSTVSALGTITCADGVNLVMGGPTTGTKIGTSATTQKIGFFNATPIVQPLGSSQGAITVTGGTYGFNSEASAASIVTLLSELRYQLVQLGIVKGSA